MKIYGTQLRGPKIIPYHLHNDHRGSFFESYRESHFFKNHFHLSFRQDNVSFSNRNVLRGLHFQNPNPQAKLITVLKGKVFDVAVDLLKTSPTFGKWMGVELDKDSGKSFLIPETFAHGFVALSEEVIFHYKCSNEFDPDSEKSVIWNDSSLNISWPINNPILSEKDKQARKLLDFNDDELFNEPSLTASPEGLALPRKRPELF